MQLQIETSKLLSPRFTFGELTVTSRADLLQKNRISGVQYIQNLSLLANYILEPAGSLLNTPFIITSAYRCADLNKIIGGKENSQHLLGQAADIVPQSISLREAFEKLKTSNICYGQLIYEGRWIHISLGAPFRPLEKCLQSFEL